MSIKTTDWFIAATSVIPHIDPKDGDEASHQNAGF